MSQHDPANAPDPEPEPAATSPATRQRPGEMRSAAPALCLFGVNLLLVALLVSSSLWPSLFQLPLCGASAQARLYGFVPLALRHWWEAHNEPTRSRECSRP